MKKIIKTAAYLILFIGIFGCAKTVQPGANEANKRYFDAWMKVNHPNVKPTGLGIYIIEDKEGTGAKVEDEGFAIIDYTIADLDGTITSYTGKETAKMLGEYDTTTYYGPQVMTTMKNTIYAGLAEALVGMRAGGHRKVIIPSWLMTYYSYDSEKEYLEHSSSNSNTIYDIYVKDYTDSINKYEIAQIEKYIADNPAIFNDKMVNDTTGFYYQSLTADPSTEKFPSDTSIYINYTGRLLNGLVFDTTIERVAKDNGLYSATRSYEPVKIKWGEKVSDIKMGTNASSVVDGFARTLWHMHPMEKGLGVFYSPLGYSYSGSGASIPGYAPLIFEIEIVAEPED